MASDIRYSSTAHRSATWHTLSQYRTSHRQIVLYASSVPDRIRNRLGHYQTSHRGERLLLLAARRAAPYAISVPDNTLQMPAPYANSVPDIALAPYAIAAPLIEPTAPYTRSSSPITLAQYHSSR
eukprot:3941625-Rhodomonas_salina.2